MTVPDKILVGLAIWVLVLSLVSRYENWQNRRWEEHKRKRK